VKLTVTFYWCCIFFICVYHYCRTPSEPF